MALEVIGAGFRRTGTESMKRALEELGLGPCYHMYEVMPHKDRYEHWCDVFDGTDPAFDATFAGYRSTVDWPAAFFWRGLAVHYPEAKVLLTVRSSESWYASMEKTILKLLRGPQESLGIGVRLAKHVFDDRLHDRDHIIAAYERNIAEVQAAFGPDRLLTYELGSGWDPLCAFLGVDVPETPYPSGNAPDDFHIRDVTLSAERRGQG